MARGARGSQEEQAVVELAEVPIDDAEQLAGRFGTRVAIEMFDEGLVSPEEFLRLCADAADALEREASSLPPRCQRPGRRHACAAKSRQGRVPRVAVGA
jgi:hypothetical protein